MGVKEAARSWWPFDPSFYDGCAGSGLPPNCYCLVGYSGWRQST